MFVVSWEAADADDAAFTGRLWLVTVSTRLILSRLTKPASVSSPGDASTCLWLHAAATKSHLPDVLVT